MDLSAQFRASLSGSLLEIQCCKWLFRVLILGVCALVQLHCGGDFGGTCSHISKLSYVMKVPF